jgi:hypothetical protein
MRFVIQEVRATAPVANYDEFNELCESARRILERSDILLSAVPVKAAAQQRRSTHAQSRPDRERASFLQLLSVVCVP